MKANYDSYMKCAAKYYLALGYFGGSCEYNKGVAFGFGYALGYEYDDMSRELDAVIAAAEKE